MLRSRKGIALLNVMLFTSITTIFLIAATQYVMNNVRQGRAGKTETLTYNVALAGITHAVSWMQKQSTQPVTVFDPKTVDPAVNPDEESETLASEEQLGLVHEFVVDPNRNLWGRYEVGRSSQAPSPAPTRSPNVSQTGAHSTLYPDPIGWTAEDVSLQRGAANPGSVWRIRSRGYLFERTSQSVAFSPASPKPVLRSTTLEAEVRMSSLQFRNAALYSFLRDASDAIDNDVEFVEGGGSKPHLEVADGTARNFWLHSSDVAPDPLTDGCDCVTAPESSLVNESNASGANYVNPALAAQLAFVFGTADLAAVKAMADSYYDQNNDVPSPLPDMSIVYIKPSGGSATITFNNGNPLSGGGILFIEGNLVLDGNSADQTWDGLIFVTGDYTQKKSSTVTGAVMVGRKAILESDGAKVPNIIYSASQLDLVKRRLGNYRLERSTLRVIDNPANSIF